jgi:predicted MFS family arabinose efflux permease
MFPSMEKKKLPSGILFIQLLVLMSYSSIAVLTLIPLYFEYLGGEPRQIGFFVSLFAFAALLARPFGGWLLSRENPRKVAVGGLVLTLVATVAYLFINRLDWILGLVRVLHGMGFSLFILAALLIVVLKSEEHERAYAIGVVSTGFMLPLLVVPFLGEKLIEEFGFPTFFLAATLLAIVPVVMVLVSKIDLPQGPEEPKRQGLSYFRLLKQGRLLLIILLTFIFEVGLSAVLSFVPLLALQGSSLRSGYFYTFLGLTAVFLRLYVGKKLTFWGSPKLILPAFLFICLGSLLTSLSHGNVLLSISGFFWGLGVGILYPHLSALCVEGSASKERGKALSLFASSVDLGFALGPLTFGWLVQFVGLRKSFILVGVFMILTSLPLEFALKRRIKCVES